MYTAARSHAGKVVLLCATAWLLSGCSAMYTEHFTVRSSIPSWAVATDKLVLDLAPALPLCKNGQSAHLKVDARSGARYNSRYDKLERDTTISRQATCK
jgi:hypothetical protein